MLIALDLSNLAVRAWFAGGAADRARSALAGLIGRELGRQVGARLTVAADRPGPSWRSVVYPAYKAARPAMPDDLRAYLADVLARVIWAGVPVLSWPGLEADDLLQGVADWHADRGQPVTIVSGDHDLWQAIRPGHQPGQPDLVTVQEPGRDGRRWTAELLRAEHQLWPSWVPAYKALVGDTSDNVAGVAGVGPVTAREILAIWAGDLEALLGLEAGAAIAYATAARGGTLPGRLETGIRATLADPDAVRLALSCTRLDLVATHPALSPPLGRLGAALEPDAIRAALVD